MVDVMTQAKAAEEAAAETEEEVAVEQPVSEETKEWDDLLEETEDSEVVEEAPEESSEEVAEETAVEEAPSEEEVPVEAEEKPVEVVEETEEVPAVAEVPEEPQAEDTRTPEEFQAEIEKAREDAREKLVETFTWNEEQAERFEEDPGGVLSELAADMFLDLYDSISNGFRAQLPGMVHGILQMQKAQQKSEEQFYSAWPDLAKSEYRPTIDRIREAYQKQNPNVDAETAVQEIGAQAWVALRLPLDELVARTRKVETVEEPVQLSQAHVPANAGNTVQAARKPVAQKSTNEFEQLATEFINDDETF